MKPFHWFTLVAIGAAVIAFFPRDPSTPRNPKDWTQLHGTRQPRAARPEADFWNAAQVPDPGYDPPVIAIRPANLGIHPPTAPVDHPARITQAILADDLPALQSAAVSWFESDPAAARDWLASQSTLDALQPAISYIVSNIAEKGDLRAAIDWSTLLTDPAVRDDTLFNIHALALRNGRITPAEIPLELIPQDRHAELLSGAAGD